MAVVGITVNGVAALRLRRGASLNERLASWHLLEDVLGWVAVLAGGAAVWLWDLRIIDPILSIGISLFVIWNVLANLKTVGAVFLQRVPKEFDTAEFVRTLRTLPLVTGVHHTHVWTLDGERHVLTTHLTLASNASRNDVAEIKRQVRGVLDSRTFEHVTIDVELEGEECVSPGSGERSLLSGD